ncbi:MAG: Asp-tRNA(Asn)/Glu-tRNA(Gln) amidotransferase subunit GatB [bacterium]|nr:Asp-tRNA(Asn)/Glu-tRNA(Gln) amidotransferase subunit GatB [Candidatus Binatota bacterium]
MSHYEQGDWEAVIGIETHVQMLTRSKLFCGCSASFGAQPNEHTCPVCQGMPGVLPVVNAQAVEYAVMAALALGGEVQPTSRWARKNYFYPDLPKAYQVSQYELPYCLGGQVTLVTDGEERNITLTRIHMEEDAGKSIHDAHSDFSYVDLNRAGVPLMEIVSEPEIRSAAESAAYMRKLRTVVRWLGICDGNMNEGSMRCDANVSLRKRGTSELGTRAEVKNMNSFRAVERAVNYEIERQAELLNAGEEITQETRLWDADHGVTRSMRSKEEAHDYRYFPCPDLLPLVIADELVERVRAALPELPDTRRARFVESYDLSAYDAEVLTASRELADYYEAAVAAHDNPKLVANWVMGDVLRATREAAGEGEVDYSRIPLAPERLGALLALVDDGSISGKIAKTVFDRMLTDSDDPADIVKREGLAQVSDSGQLEAWIAEVVDGNPDKVEDYRGGRDKLLGWFVGQVMQLSRGQANPGEVNRLLRERLAG